MEGLYTNLSMVNENVWQMSVWQMSDCDKRNSVVNPDLTMYELFH